MKYDRNINELLDNYIAARKSGNIIPIEVALEKLLLEISDLVVEIYNTAITEAERDKISESIHKMARH